MTARTLKPKKKKNNGIRARYHKDDLKQFTDDILDKHGMDFLSGFM